MKKILLLSFAIIASSVGASAAISLDSCRHMAVRNNKDLVASQLKIEQAGYQRKEAHAAYLPAFDFTGAYIYNSRKIALIEEDALLPVKNFDLASGGYQFNIVNNPATGQPLVVNGQPVPAQVALLPKSAMTYNIHNIILGSITVTQPIYMGGKIKAMNEITRYAEQLAHSMHDSKMEEVIYSVDAAYWQVVSLKAKQRLAESYLQLVKQLDDDVKRLVAQGVATHANQLTVDVKVNEAEVALTKVNNGVALAKMALAQLCGMKIDSNFTLTDEDLDAWALPEKAPVIDMNQVYANRHDLHSLELATNIYDQKARVTRSEMLPQVAAVGAFHVMNPNSYDGFKNRFGAAFSVGAMVKIPLWHWGGLSNKYKAAQIDARMKRVELDNAREKVELQVNQAAFRYQESYKTLEMTRANLTKADENLRVAQISFREGLATTDDILTAQTAWLQANSEKIDAEIDVMLCDVYLSKVLGNMNVNY